MFFAIFFNLINGYINGYYLGSLSSGYDISWTYDIRFIIGFILMAMVFSWLMTATEAWVLYLLATFFGFSTSIDAVQSPLVAELFGLHSHGQIFGFTGLGYASGSAVGPFVAGYIFDVTGSYMGAFLLCSLINVIGVVLIAILKPTVRESS